MPSPRQIFARHVLPVWRRAAIAFRTGDGAAHLLVDDPPILHVLYWTDRKDPLAFLDPLLDAFRDRPIHILCSFSWNMDSPKAIEFVARVDARRARRHRGQRVHYLACTHRQLEQLRARGLSAILCNHNALVDESVFHPIPGRSRRYDAIYDARLSPFKRHGLAEKVDRLALLTAPVAGQRDRGYAEEIRRRLADARWCNSPFEPGHRSLTPVEVNACLNEARVGLCLSAEEGAMYASIQYLLAGLPVVTTPSAGGRDVFFDPDYTAVVAAEPMAVAEGVRRMIGCPIPADEIREKTLARMRDHRARLIALVDTICLEHGRPRRFADEWGKVFFDKLARYPTRFGPIARRIGACRARGRPAGEISGGSVRRGRGSADPGG